MCVGFALSYPSALALMLSVLSYWMGRNWAYVCLWAQVAAPDAVDE